MAFEVNGRVLLSMADLKHGLVSSERIRIVDIVYKLSDAQAQGIPYYSNPYASIQVQSASLADFFDFFQKC